MSGLHLIDTEPIRDSTDPNPAVLRLIDTQMLHQRIPVTAEAPEPDTAGGPPHRPEPQPDESHSPPQVGATEQQLNVLKTWFAQNTRNPFPSAAQEQRLSELSGLSETQVHDWFSEERARQKRIYHQRKASQAEAKSRQAAKAPIPRKAKSVMSVAVESPAQDDVREIVRSDTIGVKGRLQVTKLQGLPYTPLIQAPPPPSSPKQAAGEAKVPVTPPPPPSSPPLSSPPPSEGIKQADNHVLIARTRGTPERMKEKKKTRDRVAHNLLRATEPVRNVSKTLQDSMKARVRVRNCTHQDCNERELEKGYCFSHYLAKYVRGEGDEENVAGEAQSAETSEDTSKDGASQDSQASAPRDETDKSDKKGRADKDREKHKEAESAVQLRHSVNEFIQTERDYVRGLETLYVHCAQRLKVMSEFEGSFLNYDDISSMFMDPGVDKLYVHHQCFVKELFESGCDLSNERDLLRVFSQHATALTPLYVQYAKTYKEAGEALHKARLHPEVNEFFLCTERLMKIQNMTALLVTPIQRVLKYPLLLKAILKGLEEGSIRARAAQDCLDQLLALAEDLNESIRQSQEHEKMLQVEELIGESRRKNFAKEKKPCLELVTETRKLKQKLDVKKIHTTGLHLTRDRKVQLYLFNDLLIYAEQRKWKREIPLDELEIHFGAGERTNSEGVDPYQAAAKYRVDSPTSCTSAPAAPSSPSSCPLSSPASSSSSSSSLQFWLRSSRPAGQSWIRFQAKSKEARDGWLEMVRESDHALSRKPKLSKTKRASWKWRQPSPSVAMMADQCALHGAMA